jgi:hypothetical protein
MSVISIATSNNQKPNIHLGAERILRAVSLASCRAAAVREQDKLLAVADEDVSVAAVHAGGVGASNVACHQ